MGECFFWYRPTRVVADKRPLNGCVCVCVCVCVCLIVSLTKQVSVRFLDAPAQQFTVRPTSRAELRPTDRHAYELLPTPQAGRSPATFSLRFQVAVDRSVCGVGRSLVCMSVSWSQSSSRNQLALCWPYSAVFCGSVSKQCTNLNLATADTCW